MNNSTKLAWSQYEAGKEYKRRIGLYETVRQNERFYRGEQWKSGEGGDLPRPVFNVIKRIVDYLVCTVASSNLTINYTDENLSFLESEAEREKLHHGLEVLSSNASYRWERNSMDNKLMRMLTDAAITGDGALYCYWDTSTKTPQLYSGDIATDIVDNVNIFLSDVNSPDIQSQDYIILAGRATVASLKKEAAEWGVAEEDIARIKPDGDRSHQSGEMAGFELDGEEEAKATYIIKFHKENDRVVFEKSTKECLIKRGKTDCRLYPIAYLNWMPTKNSYHGTSPVTAMIPNQKFINRAYAMAMKHMTDTAFSKVIYDKSKIPEWTNEVGQAIAAVGGGNISDAVSVLGVGELQNGYMELITSAIELTEETMGATESALGNGEAINTSAILALQETSRIPLEQIRSGYYKFVEDLANIWADMMCAYYPSERLIPYCSQGKDTCETVDFAQLKRGFLNARIDVAPISRYSAVTAQNMLDKLLDKGYISPAAYIKRLPYGVISNRQSIIDDIEQRAADPTSELQEQTPEKK